MDGVKALGVVLGVLATFYGIGDRTGFRPAWKFELDEQGWFNRRLYLRDKIDAGTATPRDIGEFCGLSMVLKQPLAAECNVPSR